MDNNRGKTAILKQDTLGRVTHTREQREALLDEFERSGMKGLPFARMAGVNYQTFASWIQKRRRFRGDYARMASKRPSTAQSGQKPRSSLPLQLVEVALPSALVTSPPPLETATLELLLPGGARLLLHDARQTELAAHLLRSLSLSPLPSPSC